MGISKWLLVLMCAGSAVATAATTFMIVSNSECTASSDQKNADSSFKNQPTLRGGSKGY